MAAVSQIKLPNSTIVDIHDSRIVDLVDNSTVEAGAWLAKTTPASLISSYSEGIIVKYKLTYAGAATTTLNVNGLGAKTVYQYGSTKLDTQYPVGTVLYLYYSSINDGCWMLINGYDTTYTITGGTNSITVTPSHGSSYDVTITPSITSGVTEHGTISANNIITGYDDGVIQDSGIGIETTLSPASDVFIPTSKAIATYVEQQSVSALTYKGTVGTDPAALPASHKQGDVWVVDTAGTYAGKACEVGDYIICNHTRTTANDSDWDVVNGENQVSDNNPTLAWGTQSKVATVDGTDIHVTMPSNPNTDNYVSTAAFASDGADAGDGVTMTLTRTDTGTVTASIPVATSINAGVIDAPTAAKLATIPSTFGTVTSVATGEGLSGGPITTSGTISLAKATTTSLGGMKPSNVVSGSTTVASGSTADRYYGVQLDSNGLAFVNVPWANDNTTYSAGTGLSLSGTTFNHSNSVTAKTTQGLYPIKYDGQGHITGSGDAVTSLPASDVYSWAKASTKPSYTYSEVGAAASNHTHTTSIATSSGTNQLTMAANTKYAITAGGTTFVFTTPADTNTWRPVSDSVSSTSSSDAASSKAVKTAYDLAASKTTVTESTVSGWGFTKNTGTVTSVNVGSTSYTPSGGVVSLPAYPTTLPASDVYSWAKASSKPSYAYSEISGTPSSLPANGGNADTVDSQHFTYSNTSNSPTYLWGTNSSGTNFLAARASISVNYATSAGSAPASDVYSWAKASSKPSYNLSEVPMTISDHGTSSTTLAITPNVKHTWGTVSALTITLSTTGAFSGGVNEYLFSFVSGTTATTLSLPSSIKWADGTAPTIEAGMTYEVSIVDSCALVRGFKAA